MTDSATRKLFAKLDELKKSIDERLGGIEKQMSVVAANSRLVVETVKSHGSSIGDLRSVVERLQVKCPMARPDTDEYEIEDGENGEPRAGSGEYEALRAAVEDGKK